MIPDNSSVLSRLQDEFTKCQNLDLESDDLLNTKGMNGPVRVDCQSFRQLPSSFTTLFTSGSTGDLKDDSSRAVLLHTAKLRRALHMASRTTRLCSSPPHACSIRSWPSFIMDATVIISSRNRNIHITLLMHLRIVRDAFAHNTHTAPDSSHAAVFPIVAKYYCSWGRVIPKSIAAIWLNQVALLRPA